MYYILLLVQMLIFFMFQQHRSKTPIFTYSSLWNIFTMEFIGYLYVRYIPMCRYIGYRGRSIIFVVARSSSAIQRHDQGVVIRSKIEPSDTNPEAALSSSFPYLFLLLYPPLSPQSWFFIATYVSSQQRPSTDYKIPDVSLQRVER